MKLYAELFVRIRGVSPTNLRKFREFYRACPEIRRTLSVESLAGLVSLPRFAVAYRRTPAMLFYACWFAEDKGERCEVSFSDAQQVAVFTGGL